jgi:hypothetical protein
MAAGEVEHHSDVMAARRHRTAGRHHGLVEDGRDFFVFEDGLSARPPGDRITTCKQSTMDTLPVRQRGGCCLLRDDEVSGVPCQNPASFFGNNQPCKSNKVTNPRPASNSSAATSWRHNDKTSTIMSELTLAPTLTRSARLFCIVGCCQSDPYSCSQCKQKNQHKTHPAGRRLEPAQRLRAASPASARTH